MGAPKSAKLSGARRRRYVGVPEFSPVFPGSLGADLAFFLRGGGSDREPAEEMERKRSWLTGAAMAAETVRADDL